MPALPYSKFYWRDWLSDPRLRLCGLAARGLWMDMLALAGIAEERGYVVINGELVGTAILARVLGIPITEVDPALTELESHGVFSRDGKGRIYSRRMVRDEKIRRDSIKNGKLGGNPSISNQRTKSDRVNPLPQPPCGKPLTSNQNQEEESTPSVGPPPRKSRTPRTAKIDLAAWEPTPEATAFAEHLHLDADAILQKIRDWAPNAPAGKRLVSDPLAFWRNWCRRERPAPRSNGHAVPAEHPMDRAVAAFSAAVARYGDDDQPLLKLVKQ